MKPYDFTIFHFSVVNFRNQNLLTWQLALIPLDYFVDKKSVSSISFFKQLEI